MASKPFRSNIVLIIPISSSIWCAAAIIDGDQLFNKLVYTIFVCATSTFELMCLVFPF